MAISDETSQLEWAYDTESNITRVLADGWNLRPLAHSDWLSLYNKTGSLISDNVSGASTWEEKYPSEPPNNLHPFVPKWVYSLKLMKSIPESWAELVQYARQGWISQAVLELWFRGLFPFSEVPSCVVDIYGSLETKQSREICCGGCEVNRFISKWEDIAIPCSGHRIPETQETSCCLERIIDFDSYMVGCVFQTMLDGSGNYSLETYAHNLNKFFPFNEAVGQVSSNLDLGTVVLAIVTNNQCCKNGMMAIKTLLRWYVGSRNQLVASLFLVLFGLKANELDWDYIELHGLAFVCEDTWLDFQKYHHNKIRKQRGDGITTWRSGVVSNMLYWHVLYGRSTGTISWSEEADERICHIPTKLAFVDGFWSEDEADLLIKQSLSDVFGKMVPHHRELEPMEVHFKRRFEWFASGSAVGYDATLTMSDIREIFGEEVTSSDRPRGNKRSVGETLCWDDIWKVTEMDPFILAKGQIKLNELGGKVRSIYNVILDHFILDEMILCDIEGSLNTPGIDLKEDAFCALCSIKERRSWCLDRHCVNSYDYPNFNALHQAKHYAMIYELASKWYEINYPDNLVRKQKITLCNWLAKAIRNQWFFDPDKQVYYRTLGTLFSGSRDTTLVNTLLNKAYGHMIEVTNTRIYGVRATDKSFYHGDDLVSLGNDIVHSLMWNETAQKCGLGANSIKLITDIGYCEYLRFLYFPDGTVRGSVVRAIATFINGNWESVTEKNPISRARSLWDQMSIMFRRGLEATLCDKLFLLSANYWTPTLNKGEVGPRLNESFIRLTTADGGLGLSRFGVVGDCDCLKDRARASKIKNILRDSRNRTSDIGEKLVSKNVPRRMTEDYISYFKEEMKAVFTIPSKDMDRLRADLVMSSLALEIPGKFIEGKLTNDEMRQILSLALGAKAPKVAPKNSDVLVLGYSLLGSELKSPDRRFVISTNRYNRLKPIIPYLKPRGMSKRKAISQWLNISQESLDRMMVLDRYQFDRCDGGRLSSFSMSFVITMLGKDISRGCDITPVIKQVVKENPWWIKDLKI